MPSVPRPVAAAVLAAAVVATGLSACSVRLETPPVITPTPSDDTLLRDASAVAEQAVLLASLEDPSGCDEFAGDGTASLETSLAPVRLEALGGVYVAFPSAEPDPTPSPEPSRACLPTVLAAIDTAVEGATAAQDTSLAALLGSIAISHALASHLVGDDPSWTLDLDETAAALDPAVAAELARMHDAARFAYETLAATVDGDERDGLLALRDSHAVAVEALLDAPGVADLREGVYVVDLDVPPAQAVALAEQGIGEAYLEAFASSTPERSRELLVAAATYLRAALDASGAEVSALPGLGTDDLTEPAAGEG